MKTLYIHGLDSFPVPEKLEILKSYDLEVLALHIDYRSAKNVYQTLKDYCLQQKVEFIVGSSMGGYLGYWLSEDLGLPCLLFNPAMTYSKSLDEHLPEIQHRQCPARYVVLGSKDEKVDPVKNQAFFQSKENEPCFQRVLTCQWLHHQIDYVSFEELTGWALKSYKIFNKS